MWTYVQASGELLDDAGKVVGVGYSGKGAAKNDPAQQCFKDNGPLPRGHYTIHPAVHPPNSLGPLALPLEPDAGNDMCHRSGFYIHGDKIGAPGTASDGCIILNHDLRKTIDDGTDKRLHVVATHP
jgi:type VI secretion system (T6SS) effector TldE1-like protein